MGKHEFILDSLHMEIEELQNLSMKCTDASTGDCTLTDLEFFKIGSKLQELAQIKMDEADVLEEDLC